MELRGGLVEINEANNHVHLLEHFPPRAARSRPVSSLKGIN
ncbi:hypothetical protein [Streptomyces fructofermentans]